MGAFKVGDEVTWTSSAGGSTKRKTGTVIQVIPGGGSSAQIVKTAINARAGSARSAFGGGWARPDESYLVEVPGAGPRSKPVLYWPRASVLRKA